MFGINKKSPNKWREFWLNKQSSAILRKFDSKSSEIHGIFGNIVNFKAHFMTNWSPQFPPLSCLYFISSVSINLCQNPIKIWEGQIQTRVFIKLDFKQTNRIKPTRFWVWPTQIFIGFWQRLAETEEIK